MSDNNKASNNSGHFICCELCGKKLIKRLPNGLFHFAFGKNNKSGSRKIKPPVNIYVHGSVMMECLSDSCDHMNVLNYFPNVPAKSVSNDSEEKTISNEKLSTTS